MGSGFSCWRPLSPRARGLRVQLLAAAVAPGQEQQLLHQGLHVFGLGLDGGDGFLQHLLVVLAPAVQHLHIALDHGDGRAQLVAGVGDELGLLAIGGLHAVQQVVDGALQALQVLVAGGQPAVDVDLADGVLQVVELRLVHAAAVQPLGLVALGAAAGAGFVRQPLGGLGHAVQGLQQLARPAGAAQEAEHPAAALEGDQRPAEAAGQVDKALQRHDVVHALVGEGVHQAAQRRHAGKAPVQCQRAGHVPARERPGDRRLLGVQIGRQHRRQRQQVQPEDLPQPLPLPGAADPAGDGIESAMWISLTPYTSSILPRR